MKRIASTLYTKGRLAANPLRFIYDENGYLFSRGKYRTKILPTDLPEWFVPVYIYKDDGYLSAKGVKHLVYKPNFFTNHLHKDDILYVSYAQRLTPFTNERGYEWYENYDHVLSGSSILPYLDAVEKYSGYDVSDIRSELQRKREWYIGINPPGERYDLHE